MAQIAQIGSVRVDGTIPRLRWKRLALACSADLNGPVGSSGSLALLVQMAQVGSRCPVREDGSAGSDRSDGPA